MRRPAQLCQQAHGTTPCAAPPSSNRTRYHKHTCTNPTRNTSNPTQPPHPHLQEQGVVEHDLRRGYAQLHDAVVHRPGALRRAQRLLQVRQQLPQLEAAVHALPHGQLALLVGGELALALGLAGGPVVGWVGQSSVQVLRAASAGNAQKDRPSNLMRSALPACPMRAAASVTRRAGREPATASLASTSAQSDSLVRQPGGTAAGRTPPRTTICTS